MMPRRTWSILAAVAAAVLMVQCGNLGLCGGGGTETSNPGMMACAGAVFEEAEQTGRWNPTTYLPQGEAQLNPGCIIGSGALSKSVMPDTDTVVSGNHNELRISWSRDTMIFIDTLFVRDTVSIDSVKSDTSHPSSDFTIVVSQRVVDQIIIVDTVEKRDTLYVPRWDTLFIKLTDSLNAPVMTIRDTVPGNKTTIYKGAVPNPYPVVIRSISADSVSLRIIPVTGNAIWAVSQVTLPTPPDTGYSSIMRISNAVGNLESEEYQDADGDGFLNKASGSLSMRARLLANYDNVGVRTSLSVMFDAGGDKIFSTTGDNRILLLSRSQQAGNRLIEEVRYAEPARDSSLDSTVLTIEQHPETGKVQDVDIYYACRQGKDTLDHRQNKLTAFRKNITFRSGTVQSLDVSTVLDTAVGQLEGFRNSRVSARMLYGAARMGTFEGSLDMTERTLSGIYTENGTSYRVTYTRSDGNLRWEEMLSIY